ncbi:hypothetical protein HU200_003901 [Digitaria exilis]|uniref:Uncharacterized protein n=1 Tax=Digitaria exilis TaxID=1010633 RepID=A0A835KVJ1_9POAL|nr:hypothetical protein HU200_003901 [Digitaria exilis]
MCRVIVLGYLLKCAVSAASAECRRLAYTAHLSKGGRVLATGGAFPAVRSWGTTLQSPSPSTAVSCTLPPPLSSSARPSPAWIHSMDPHLSSHVHAATAASAPSSPGGRKAIADALPVPPPPAIIDIEAGAPENSPPLPAAADPIDGAGGEVDYMARAQWLRAAVLGANDGLVSVASLMIGVGAVNATGKAMLVSGLAGLVAGACSMAIGEFVSVYAQYDIEVTQLKRDGTDRDEAARDALPSPTQAALASALAFAFGALLPLLSGVFVPSWWARLVAVCAASSVGLAGFGAAGAYLVRGEGAPGGWFAMIVTFGVLRVFGSVFHIHVSSA